MKRTFSAVTLSAALLAGSILPAGAANAGQLAAFGALSALVSASGVVMQQNSATPPVQNEQEIGFGSVERIVRAGNPTIKMMDQSLHGIQTMDPADSMFIARDQIASVMNGVQESINNTQKTLDDLIANGGSQSAIDSYQATLSSLKLQLSSLQQQYASVDKHAEEDAQDKIDEQFLSSKQQFGDSANQLVIGAQQTYISIENAKAGLETLDRNIEMLERNITVLEKQQQMGMTSTLALENARQQLTDLRSKRASTVRQLEGAENTLSLLCGNTADTTVKTAALPTVTDYDLSQLNYEQDLAAALENSYSIWAKQDAVRKASNDYEDNITSTLDALNAAKTALAAEKENVSNAFRSLYNTLMENRRLRDEAKQAYALAEHTFSVQQLQYQQGTLSLLDYQTAQNDLAAAADAARTAEVNLLTAFTNYNWAKRGTML